MSHINERVVKNRAVPFCIATCMLMLILLMHRSIERLVERFRRREGGIM